MQIANDEKLNNIHTIHVDYIRKRSMMIKKREKKIDDIIKIYQYTPSSPTRTMNSFRHFCLSPPTHNNIKSDCLLKTSNSQRIQYPIKKPFRLKKTPLSIVKPIDKKGQTMSLFAKNTNQFITDINMNEKDSSDDDTIIEHCEQMKKNLEVNKESSRNKSNSNINQMFTRYGGTFSERLKKVYNFSPINVKTLSKIRNSKAQYPLDTYQNCLLQTASSTFSVDSVKRLDEQFKIIRKKAENNPEMNKEYIKEIEDEEEDIFYNINKAEANLERIINEHFNEDSKKKPVSLPKIKMKRIFKLPKKKKKIKTTNKNSIANSKKNIIKITLSNI